MSIGFPVVPATRPQSGMQGDLATRPDPGRTDNIRSEAPLPFESRGLVIASPFVVVS